MERSQVEQFDAFARAQMSALLRFAVLLTGQQSDAEDLLQAALAQTLARWSRVVGADSVEAYVRRIMVNTHRSGLRRAFRRREVLRGELPEAGDRGVSGVEDRLVLHAALASLTVAQRAVVILRFLEDRSEAETALVLGVTVGTVKSQTHKAIQRLRAHPLLATDVAARLGRST